MADLTSISGTDRPAGNHARFVGRVGGLACALGVGTAVFAGTGVAAADTTDSGTSGSERASASSSSSSQATGARRGVSASKARSTLRSTPSSGTDALTDGAEVPDVEVTRSQRAPMPAAAEARSSARAASTDSAPANLHSEAGLAPAAAVEVVAPAQQASAAVPIQIASPTAAAVGTNSFFNNQTPTLNYNAAQNLVVDGHIMGNLHPVDADSTKLTYTATTPSAGTVKIDPNGTFDYTPGVNFTSQDMFDVTVSDAGSGFHIHGFAGLLNLLTFGLLGTSGHKTTQTVLIGDQRTVVASGLDKPVDFRFLPDGRILVAQKGGAIKVIQADGTVRDQPLITLSVNEVGERGISGLAVDPHFSENGRIYVAYTTSGVKDRLSRFTVVGNTAALGSELVLMETTETVGTNHHGGALDFGPDGKLYWGKGDNGSGANAQNLTNIYGKILRLNPDGSTPSDNPVLPAGALPQIYAYGLRNPFRMAFTPTGQLLVADVGNAAYEELNKVVAGGNYGWPGSEGVCTSNCAGLINPIYTYGHGNGAAFSSVLAYDHTKVFIADEVQGWIKMLTCDAQYTACGSPQNFDPDAGTTVALLHGPGSDTGMYQLIYQPGALVRFNMPSST